MSVVLYEKHGHVARVTLNRPECLNAMNSAMHLELSEVWDDFEKDDDIWVGVISGSGRAFSVGQDLKELADKTQVGIAPSSFGSKGRAGYPRLTERFSLTKPIIAKVNGYALGGGLELALACDIIIASDRAELALPEARLGLIPGAGGVFRLSRQIPIKVALGFLLTGRRISAERAYELGLINQVTTPDNLDVEVEAWVEDILRCSPLSVRAIKEAAYKSSTMPLHEAFAAEYMWEHRRMAGNDLLEGVLAFVQKRAPNWSTKLR